MAGQARTYWPCLSEQLPQELFCDLFVQVAHVTCSLLIPILCMLADQISTYSSRDAPPRRSHIVYCDYVYLGSKKVRSCHSYVLTSLFTNAQVAGPFIDCACQWQEMRTLNMSPSSPHGRRPSTHVRRMTRLRQAHRMTRAETWRHAVSMPGMIWKSLPRVHQPHMDVPFGAIRPFNSTIIYRLRAYTMSGLPHTHSRIDFLHTPLPSSYRNHDLRTPRSTQRSPRSPGAYHPPRSSPGRPSTLRSSCVITNCDVYQSPHQSNAPIDQGLAEAPRRCLPLMILIGRMTDVVLEFQPI